MGLRLLLVGFVAALGFDLPARERVEGWTRTAQSWLRGTLDDWNTWSPACDEMCEIDAVETPHPPVRVAGVTDEGFGAVIEEIVASFEVEEAAVAARAACEQNLTQAGGPKVAEATGPAIVDPPAAPVVAATLPVLEKEQAPAGFDLIEVTDSLFNDPAYVLNQANEGLGPIEASPAPAPAPVQVAEEEEVEVEQRSALTSNLVPPAEATVIRVVEPAAEVQQSAAAPTGVRRLATALRLTGQALEAWGKFLEAPAVVSLRP